MNLSPDAPIIIPNPGKREASGTLFSTPLRGVRTLRQIIFLQKKQENNL
jgi:hypothetical protein